MKWGKRRDGKGEGVKQEREEIETKGEREGENRRVRAKSSERNGDHSETHSEIKQHYKTLCSF